MRNRGMEDRAAVLFGYGECDQEDLISTMMLRLCIAIQRSVVDCMRCNFVAWFRSVEATVGSICDSLCIDMVQV